VQAASPRWANILAGAFIIILVLLAGTLIEKIPITVLAAMLVVAGLLALNVGLIYAIWLTGMTARIVMVLAFTVTMVFPIWIAVFFCMGINALLHVFGLENRA
jgi:SulP family sulfate permease